MVRSQRLPMVTKLEHQSICTMYIASCYAHLEVALISSHSIRPSPPLVLRNRKRKHPPPRPINPFVLPCQPKSQSHQRRAPRCYHEKNDRLSRRVRLCEGSGVVIPVQSAAGEEFGWVMRFMQAGVEGGEVNGKEVVWDERGEEGDEWVEGEGEGEEVGEEEGGEQE